MLDYLLTLLFPRRCVGCKISGSYLCTNCQDELEPATDPDLPDAYAVFSYREPLVRKLVKMLKYKNTKDTASTVADIMYRHFLEEITNRRQYFPTAGKILIIPIPAHKHRLKERGYNQAREIAKHFVNYDPQNFQLLDSLLIKTRATDSQVSVKNRAKRLANLKGAFTVSSPPMSRFNLDIKTLGSQFIILIDDVITTGATMEEAALTLRQAGAKQILCLALAHG